MWTDIPVAHVPGSAARVARIRPHATLRIAKAPSDSPARIGGLGCQLRGLRRNAEAPYTRPFAFRRTEPSAMHEDTERRLTNLEIKASDAEVTIDRLNDVIVRQQAQIDMLLREVALLRAQTPADEAPGFRSLRDELPPHY
jgi:SlyX protein